LTLRYLRHPEIDLAAWDACVAAAQPTGPYVYSWWLACVTQHWDAVVEYDAATGGYCSVLPLPTKRRLGLRQVYQPAFTQQLGLLTTENSHYCNLADYLALIAGRFSHFYLQLNVGNQLAEAPHNFTLTERQTYLLNLSADYASLFSGYTSDYRRRLRRNQQQPLPLRVVEMQTATELIQLFRLHKGGEVTGVKTRQYQQLAALVEALQTRHLAKMIGVRQPGTNNLLAGALFVQHQGGLIYLFAAASPVGKQAGAPLLLLDYMIQQFAGTPGFVLDFEGSMIPSIARFFANFGALPASYMALSQTIRQHWSLLWKS